MSSYHAATALALAAAGATAAFFVHVRLVDLRRGALGWMVLAFSCAAVSAFLWGNLMIGVMCTGFALLATVAAGRIHVQQRGGRDVT